jgi:hypothetical protein
MNTKEVAEKVIELVRKQAWHEALDTLYDKDIVSVEADTQDGSSPELRGKKTPCAAKSIGGWMRWRFIALKRMDRSSRMTGSSYSTTLT